MTEQAKNLWEYQPHKHNQHQNPPGQSHHQQEINQTNHNGSQHNTNDKTCLLDFLHNQFHHPHNTLSQLDPEAKPPYIKIDLTQLIDQASIKLTNHATVHPLQTVIDNMDNQAIIPGIHHIHSVNQADHPLLDQVGLVTHPLIDQADMTNAQTVLHINRDQ